ncbi:MAG: hypothetical protein AB7K36_24595 [Chloroflexota bacterium]
MATMERSTVRSATGHWVTQGIIGGVVAGIIFAMFEMITAALLMGAPAFWMPLRMIGAIVLGPDALEASYPLVTAGLTGVVVHMVLSMMFGAAFGLLVANVPSLARSTGAIVIGATAFGFLLWVVNFYVLAPIFGWDWFPTQTNPIQQFVAHTFFFGSVLGFYLARMKPTHART